MAEPVTVYTGPAPTSHPDADAGFDGLPVYAMPARIAPGEIWYLVRGDCSGACPAGRIELPDGRQLLRLPIFGRNTGAPPVREGICVHSVDDFNRECTRLEIERPVVLWSNRPGN